MFFVTINWGSYPLNASNCFHCSSENIILYYKEEFPLIFPNQGKEKALRTILDKEIGLSCQRRMYNKAELLIEFDKEFSTYEIEIFSDEDHKPIIQTKTDRQRFIASNLEENRCYVARVRGANEDFKIYTKWSKECSFYPLKGFFFKSMKII